MTGDETPLPTDPEAAPARKRWVTPRVILSECRETETNFKPQAFPDSSSNGNQYGS